MPLLTLSRRSTISLVDKEGRGAPWLGKRFRFEKGDQIAILVSFPCPKRPILNSCARHSPMMKVRDVSIRMPRQFRDACSVAVLALWMSGSASHFSRRPFPEFLHTMLALVDSGQGVHLCSQLGEKHRWRDLRCAKSAGLDIQRDSLSRNLQHPGCISAGESTQTATPNQILLEINFSVRSIGLLNSQR